jgi:phosphate transport system substrate-binding protein
MFIKRMWNIVRAKAVWGALALLVATSIHAGTLVGGGSTTTALAYAGANALTAYQLVGTNGSNAITANSLFGAYMTMTGNPLISYCQSGDGTGKDIFAGMTIVGNSFNVQNACNNPNNPTMFWGFGAAAVDRSDLISPNFLATNIPLNAFDISNYQSARSTSAWPTQFPAIATAVTITFNLTDTAGASITSSEVDFTSTQLCLIFSGAATSWIDPRLISAFSLPSGHLLPNTPIKVVYRLDGSDTTFSLSNFLANNCSDAGLGQVFETSVLFAGTGGVVSNFFPTSNGNSTPSGWIGASGSSILASEVINTPNSIGYLPISEVLALEMQYASVNGTDPIRNFGNTLVVNSTDLVYNETISVTNNSNGTAQVQSISNAPATQCIALIPPSAYAVVGSTGGLLPRGTYPIVSISYLVGNAQGNESSDLAATQNLVNAPYNTAIESEATTIGPNTGNAFLKPGRLVFSATAPGNCLH